jgi:hypothetical protein
MATATATESATGAATHRHHRHCDLHHWTAVRVASVLLTARRRAAVSASEMASATTLTGIGEDGRHVHGGPMHEKEPRDDEHWARPHDGQSGQKCPSQTQQQQHLHHHRRRHRR